MYALLVISAHQVHINHIFVQMDISVSKVLKIISTHHVKMELSPIRKA